MVNRVLPELFGRAEEEVFEALRGRDAVERWRRPPAAPSPPVLDAAELAVTLRRTRAEHLDAAAGGPGRDLPVLYVPELFTRTHGMRATSQVADALAAELGY